MRLPRITVSLKSWSAKTRPVYCNGGSVYWVEAPPLRTKSVLLCRRIATTGVMCMKSGFGLLMFGTSCGSDSTWSVIMPAGEGVGVALSLSSLSSESDDELGWGVGDGLAVGAALLFAPGEPLGAGVGMLNASVQLYCWLNCCTTGHFMPLGPWPIGYCASFGASVAPGLVSSSCPLAPTFGPAI